VKSNVGEAVIPTAGANMKQEKIRVAVNGYGVIGRRVADAIALQSDMELVGVADISTTWRTKIAGKKNFPIFAATSEAMAPMREAGFKIEGPIDEMLKAAQVVVDCAPKSVGA
jgi:glyceraldehyde-3-phosphate dehydrogenase (NAD(P))